jgi:hypothetical protein
MMMNLKWLQDFPRPEFEPVLAHINPVALKPDPFGLKKGPLRLLMFAPSLHATVRADNSLPGQGIALTAK